MLLGRGIACFLLWFVVNKTIRLAVDVGGDASKVGRLYFGTVDCLLKLLRLEGLKGIYNGFAVSLFG